jgi:predicted nucleic acid-binding protein
VSTLTFVDTNVIACAHDAPETVRQPLAGEILGELWQSRSGVVSTQVLSELYVVATRKFKPALGRSHHRSGTSRWSEAADVGGPAIRPAIPGLVIVNPFAGVHP